MVEVVWRACARARRARGGAEEATRRLSRGVFPMWGRGHGMSFRCASARVHFKTKSRRADGSGGSRFRAYRGVGATGTISPRVRPWGAIAAGLLRHYLRLRGAYTCQIALRVIGGKETQGRRIRAGDRLIGRAPGHSEQVGEQPWGGIRGVDKRAVPRLVLACRAGHSRVAAVLQQMGWIRGRGHGGVGRGFWRCCRIGGAHTCSLRGVQACNIAVQG